MERAADDAWDRAANEEGRRWVKTQGALAHEEAALVWLFGLAASEPIQWRKIDGHRTIAAVLRKRLDPAA